jgi:DNA-directed RNA polymerase specialized sigma24 family protein
MIGDAIIKMITALTRKRFKCDEGYNPFSYFTKVAYRAFQNRIKTEKKRHEGQLRYQSEVYDSLYDEGLMPARKNVHEYNVLDDN